MLYLEGLGLGCFALSSLCFLLAAFWHRVLRPDFIALGLMFLTIAMMVMSIR